MMRENINLESKDSSLPGLYFFGRLIIGFAFLFDWAVRFKFRDYWYGADGSLPRSLNPSINDSFHWSLFYLSDTPALVTTLFLVWLVVIVWFMTCIMPRLSALAVLLFQISHINANPYVIYAGMIYSAVLLWMVFMKPSQRTGPFFWGFLLQLGIIYSMAGICKIAPGSEWLSGDALSLVTQGHSMTNELGRFVGRSPDWITHPLTWFTLFIESVAVLFFFVKPLRTPLALCLIGFHAYLILTMRLSEFPVFLLGALVLVLDSDSWVFRRVGALFLTCLPKVQAKLNAVGANLRCMLTFIVDIEKFIVPRNGVWQLRIPALPRLITAWVVSIFLCFCVLSDVYTSFCISHLAKWNVELPNYRKKQVEVAFRGATGIKQHWSFFATTGGAQWAILPVIQGVTSSGKIIDLQTGEEPEWKHTAMIKESHIQKFWYAVNSMYENNDHKRLTSAGDAIIKRYNHSHPEDPLTFMGIWIGFSHRGGEADHWKRVWARSGITDQPSIVQVD